MISLLVKVENYIRSSAEVFRLQAIDTSADVVSRFVYKAIIAVCAVLCLFLFGTGMALLIGDWLGKIWYGFFIMGGFFLLLILLFFVFRKRWVIKPVRTSFLESVYKKEDA
ncbi:MAG: hypothetical protein R2794_14075 [Chitinophagales bacterium]